MAKLTHLELLILATVVHIFMIFMLWTFATSYTTPTLAWTLWSAIGLLAFHYLKLAGSTVVKLTRP